MNASTDFPVHLFGETFEVITPPVESLVQELPFAQLTWNSFEALCLELAAEETHILECRQYGIPGDAQHGIDFYARVEGAEKWTVFQVKNQANFGPSEIRKAVAKFLDGDWVRRTDHFVLCLRESVAPGQRADAVLEVETQLKERGIQFVPWDCRVLNKKLKQKPYLVYRYFKLAWVDAFNGREPGEELRAQLARDGIRPTPLNIPLLYRKAVLDFLEKLQRHILWNPSHVALTPPGYAPDELLDALIPPRVTRKCSPNQHEQHGDVDRPELAEGTFEPQELDCDALGPRLVLWGDPGSGKTIALWWSVARLCRRLSDLITNDKIDIHDEAIPVPLAAALSDIPSIDDVAERERDLLTICRELTLSLAYGTAGPPQEVRQHLSHWLDEKIKKRQVSVFLDALDELDSSDRACDEMARNRTPPRADWLQSEIARLPNVRIVLTSRWGTNASAILPGSRSMALLPLGADSVDAYIDTYCSRLEDGSTTAQQVKTQLRRMHRVRRLVRSPLLLALLCQDHATPDSDVEFPATNTEFFKGCLFNLLREGDRRKRYQRSERGERNVYKERLLRHIALRFYRNGPVPIQKPEFNECVRPLLARLRDDNRFVPLPESADALWDELRDDGVIVSGGRNHYRFLFRSLHEYCLAGWIACESDVGPDSIELPSESTATARRLPAKSRELIRPVTDSSWRFVWPLVVGQASESRADLVLTQVWAFSQKRSVLPWPRETVVRARAYDALLCVAECRHALSVARDIVATVSDWLANPRFTDGDDWLLQLSDRSYVNLVDCQLRDLPIGLAAAIGETAVPVLAHVILRGWFEADRHCQTSAALALGRMGVAIAAQALTQGAVNRDGGANVRLACLEALRECGDLALRNAISLVLREQTNLFVESRCLSILAERPDSAAVDIIAGALMQPVHYEYAKMLTHWLFRNAGDLAPRAFRSLVCNKVAPIFARGLCLEAWVALGDREAIELARRTLKSADLPEFCRTRSVHALTQAADEAGLQTIKMLLKARDTSAWTRIACASVIPGRESEEVLSEGLRSSSIDTLARLECIDALVELAPSAAATAFAETVLDRRTPGRVAMACVFALADIGGEVAADTLIEIVASRIFEKSEMWYVIDSMTKLKHERCRKSLQATTEDASAPEWLVDYCRSALRRLTTLEATDNTA